MIENEKHLPNCYSSTRVISWPNNTEGNRETLNLISKLSRTPIIKIGLICENLYETREDLIYYGGFSIEKAWPDKIEYKNNVKIFLFDNSKYFCDLTDKLRGYRFDYIVSEFGFDYFRKEDLVSLYCCVLGDRERIFFI